jgi:hypothetical protein
MRLQAIDWLNGLISEGPPKPKLKWEEEEAGLQTTRCKYRAVVPFPDLSYSLSIEAGTFVDEGCWYEVWLCMGDGVPVRRLAGTTLPTNPDGGYPAPFLEVEQALRNILTTVLDALNNPKP